MIVKQSKQRESPAILINFVHIVYFHHAALQCQNEVCSISGHGSMPSVSRLNKQLLDCIVAAIQFGNHVHSKFLQGGKSQVSEYCPLFTSPFFRNNFETENRQVRYILNNQHWRLKSDVQLGMAGKHGGCLTFFIHSTTTGTHVRTGQP